jgi:putative zinc finger/helix-turn-helix YgiT family protein
MAEAEHECGGTLRPVTERVTVEIRGTEVTVDERFVRCDQCGEELVPLDEVGQVQRDAATRIRETQGRITPRRIIALRESLGVTQDFFEKAVGLPKKTVVRWETGKVFPSKAVDALLRLLERDRSAFDFLCRENGYEPRRRRNA